MEAFNEALGAINTVLWHDAVLYTVLATGILFTIWSGFSQYRALTHGFAVVRGKYDSKDDPGAINHFQALSTALSGTVGLGNIAGVAVAVSLGGPGAVFWMWVVGVVGMALKLTEVTQSMLFRDTSDPDNPRGGPMWVCRRGFEKISPGLAPLGWLLGAVFCVTVMISTITGGNMFQAWNVAKITSTYAPNVPPIAVGIVLTLIVGAVIIGGIKRIGAVTGRLVPFMCGLYLLGALAVLVLEIQNIPAMLRMIVMSGLPGFLGGESVNPEGAFLGGTFGYAFLWGMKRALFSNEAGQGSAPIAHSAAKTDEPVREGVVAGLEPFIDTLVVCTITALVVISSGAWNRPPAAEFPETPGIVQARDADGNTIAEAWIPATTALPAKSTEERQISNVWRVNDPLFVVVKGSLDDNTGRDLHRLLGTVVQGQGDALEIEWKPYDSAEKPSLDGPGIHMSLPGSSLTGYAFDRAIPGMGMWVVTLASWLFAISTIISWSYYGEQATNFLFGGWAVIPYKLIYCLAVLVATIPGLIATDAELDALTALGTGVMLWANIPIMLIFGPMAMRAYHEYMGRLRSGAMTGHGYPKTTDVVEGKDVE
ncbi:MAG: alanine/glycine:cation symporter family protein [Planctomycetota bacterium]|jgi:AGCS family alanine or glycine:cation symporter